MNFWTEKFQTNDLAFVQSEFKILFFIVERIVFV